MGSRDGMKMIANIEYISTWKMFDRIRISSTQSNDHIRNVGYQRTTRLSITPGDIHLQGLSALVFNHSGSDRVVLKPGRLWAAQSEIWTQDAHKRRCGRIGLYDDVEERVWWSSMWVEGYGIISYAPMTDALGTTVIRAIVAQYISNRMDLGARFRELSYLRRMMRLSCVKYAHKFFLRS